ncbi:hypothetical protein Bca4012_081371 [Brassica carinata]
MLSSPQYSLSIPVTSFLRSSPQGSALAMEQAGNMEDEKPLERKREHDLASNAGSSRQSLEIRLRSRDMDEGFLLLLDSKMGRAKKPQKFAVMKKTISHKALKHYKEEVLNPNKKDLTELPRNVPNVPSGMFFSHNTNMVPPYRVLVDTNFINFSIQNKIDIENGMMFCLNAKCELLQTLVGIPCITDCVMAELEKLGQKYRVALRIAKDPRFERLPCVHKGTYADDCLVDRVTQVPGVPIMYLAGRKYSVERLPEATLGRGMHLFGLSKILIYEPRPVWTLRSSEA